MPRALVRTDWRGVESGVSEPWGTGVFLHRNHRVVRQKIEELLKNEPIELRIAARSALDIM